MSNQDLRTRQADEIWPMFSGSDGKAFGAVLATSTAAGVIDLTTIPAAAARVGEVNVVNRYITLAVEGADLYVNFGPTQASVTGANAPNPATTGTNVVALADYYPIGRWPMVIPAGPGQASSPGANSAGRFMGFVTKAGTGLVRISQSSP